MNEIKWQKYLEALEHNQNSAKFAKYLRILLEDDQFDKEQTEILQKIDNLLLEMSENDVKDVQHIVSEILKD